MKILANLFDVKQITYYFPKRHAAFYDNVDVTFFLRISLVDACK